MASAGKVRAGQAFVELILASKEFDKGLKNIRTNMASFGKAIEQYSTITITLAVTSLFPLRRAINEFGEFDKKMRLVNSVTNATEADFKSLSKTVRLLGRETIFSARQVSDAMLILARAGFTSKEAERGARDFLNLSLATDTNLERSIEIAAATIRGFDMPISRATEVVDILTAAANISAQSLEELGHGFKFIVPIAKSAGMSLKETAQMSAYLANMGLKGSNAATNLRNILLRMPTMQGKYKDLLNIDVKDELGNLRGLVDVLRDVKEAVDNLPSGERLVILNQLFGRYGVSGAAAFISGSEMREVFETIDNATGEASRVAEAVATGVSGSISIMANRTRDAFIELGEVIQPTVFGIASEIGFMTDDFKAFVRENADEINTFVKALAEMGRVIVEIIAAFGKFAVNHPKLTTSLLLIASTAPQILLLVKALTILKTALSSIATVGKAFAFSIKEGAATKRWIDNSITDRINAKIKKSDAEEYTRRETIMRDDIVKKGRELDIDLKLRKEKEANREYEKVLKERNELVEKLSAITPEQEKYRDARNKVVEEEKLKYDEFKKIEKDYIQKRGELAKRVEAPFARDGKVKMDFEIFTNKEAIKEAIEGAGKAAEKLKNANYDVVSLKKQIADLEAKGGEKRKLASLQKQLSAAELIKEDAGKAYLKSMVDLTTLRSADLKAEMKRVETEIASAESDLVAKKDKLEAFSGTVKDKASQFRKEPVDFFKDRVAKAKEDIEVAKKNAADLSAELDSLYEVKDGKKVAKAISGGAAKRRSLQLKLATANKKLAKSEEDLVSAEKDLVNAEVFKSYQNEIGRTEEKVVSLKKELGQLKNQDIELNFEGIEKANAEFKTLSENLVTSKKEYDKATKAVKKASKAYDKINASKKAADDIVLKDAENKLQLAKDKQERASQTLNDAQLELDRFTISREKGLENFKKNQDKRSSFFTNAGKNITSAFTGVLYGTAIAAGVGLLLSTITKAISSKLNAMEIRSQRASDMARLKSSEVEKVRSEREYIKSLFDQLVEYNKNEFKKASDMSDAKVVVDELNGKFDGLNLTLDETTKAVNGVDDALRLVNESFNEQEINTLSAAITSRKASITADEASYEQKMKSLAKEMSYHTERVKKESLFDPVTSHELKKKLKEATWFSKGDDIKDAYYKLIKDSNTAELQPLFEKLEKGTVTLWGKSLSEQYQEILNTKSRIESDKLEIEKDSLAKQKLEQAKIAREQKKAIDYTAIMTSSIEGLMQSVSDTLGISDPTKEALNFDGPTITRPFTAYAAMMADEAFKASEKDESKVPDLEAWEIARNAVNLGASSNKVDLESMKNAIDVAGGTYYSKKNEETGSERTWNREEFDKTEAGAFIAGVLKNIASYESITSITESSKKVEDEIAELEAQLANINSAFDEKKYQALERRDVPNLKELEFERDKKLEAVQQKIIFLRGGLYNQYNEELNNILTKKDELLKGAGDEGLPPLQQTYLDTLRIFQDYIEKGIVDLGSKINSMISGMDIPRPMESIKESMGIGLPDDEVIKFNFSAVKQLFLDQALRARRASEEEGDVEDIKRWDVIIEAIKVGITESLKSSDFMKQIEDKMNDEEFASTVSDFTASLTGILDTMSEIGHITQDFTDRQDKITDLERKQKEAEYKYSLALLESRDDKEINIEKARKEKEEEIKNLQLKLIDEYKSVGNELKKTLAFIDQTKGTLSSVKDEEVNRESYVFVDLAQRLIEGKLSEVTDKTIEAIEKLPEVQQTQMAKLTSVGTFSAREAQDLAYIVTWEKKQYEALLNLTDKTLAFDRNTKQGLDNVVVAIREVNDGEYI
jgi:TP901 family phage tail tape measure protein